MQYPLGDRAAGGPTSRRLFVYNGGFLRQRRVRRILHLSGFDVRLGRPAPDDLIGVWGKSPTAHRGEAIAQKYNVPLLRVEDAFLRSLAPGRAGEPPLGLLLDTSGVHFDPATPSDLEKLLATHPLDDTALLDAARSGMARMADAGLSKYSGFDASLPPPEPGYVLVVDQARGDASVTVTQAGRAEFLEMLVFAQEEHPGVPVIIKSHPETAAGYRAGYFGPEDENDRIRVVTDNIAPAALFGGAVGVYTYSSQMGFDAIFAGHKPRVFGQPFYAGWGLTQDENPVPRRTRKLTRAQLFAAAMILYPRWYDPYNDRLCDLDRVISTLHAKTRAWHADRAGWVASETRLWKRKTFQNFFGRFKPVIFENDPDKTRLLAQTTSRNQMVWAGKAREAHANATRVEDGFLRSQGLGAALVPPLSLITDDIGIYYDPSRPSGLEQLIMQRAKLRPDQKQRAKTLISRIVAGGLSKYNPHDALPDLPQGHRILVPGQVEDDASILAGTGAISTNESLLRATRNANPDAVIIYKTHPDVAAGLRAGQTDATPFADLVLTQGDPAKLIACVDEVWTMTSLLGFETLLRGKKVVTVGAPFYAGWGLTEDRGRIPPRRNLAVSLETLVHATLIDYPRYFDPVTKQPCPVEVVIERLVSGTLPRHGPFNRTLSKLQGVFASQSHLWR